MLMHLIKADLFVSCLKPEGCCRCPRSSLCWRNASAMTPWAGLWRCMHTMCLMMRLKTCSQDFVQLCESHDGSGKSETCPLALPNQCVHLIATLGLSGLLQLTLCWRFSRMYRLVRVWIWGSCMG